MRGKSWIGISFTHFGLNTLIILTLISYHVRNNDIAQKVETKVFKYLKCIFLTNEMCDENNF